MKKIQYQVSGQSMEPTLFDGDVVELVSQHWRDGDIVVAVQDGKKIVKRVEGDWLIGDNKGVSSVYPLHEVTIFGVVKKTTLSGDNGYLQKVEAATLTKTQTFSESTSRTQTQTLTIPNLKSVSNVSANTGNASYSVSGNTITFNLTNGVVSRTVQTGGSYTPADTKFVTGQSSASYNSGGYTGTLTQYVESGSYTPADTKFVTGQSSASYNSGGYTGTLTQYVESGNYTPGDTKTVSQTVGPQASNSFSPTISYNSGGYSGTLSGQGVTSTVVSGAAGDSRTETDTRTSSGNSAADSGSYAEANAKAASGLPSSISYSSGGYTGTLNRVGISYSNSYCSSCNGGEGLFRSTATGTYSGTVTKPDTRVYNYSQVYSGSVTKPPTDTRVYKFQGDVTRPASDTRVYKYQGDVTRPASDTRTYANYYQYTVIFDYSDNSVPLINLNTADNLTLSAVAGRRTITLSGTVADSDNNTVIVSATINGKTKSTSVANTSTTKTWSLTWDVVTDSIEQGTYSNIAVSANDGNGGSSTATYTGTITVDKTNPVITITGVTNGTTYQNSVTPTFSATDAGGSALSTTTATLNGSVYTSGTEINTSGAKTLIVTATDNAGNQSQQTVNFSINKGPLLTLTNPPNNSTLFEGNTLPIEGSTSDTDTGNVVTIKYKLNNGTTRALNSGVSNGSTPISFAKSLSYSKKRLWDGATDVVGADLAENTSHTLTVWTEDDQGGVSSQITRTFSVVWNRPPTISGADKSLGTISTIPSVDYSATDPEGNTFTFAEYLNGQQIRSYAGVAGQKYTATIDNDNWLRLELDTPHELKVRATDSQGLSSERVYSFTRTESKIEFALNFDDPKILDHFTCDAKPSRILVTLDAVIPSGASIEKVEVCNNAFDAAPTWEDATGPVRAGRGYVFTNSTKTATNWGINIRVAIDKGTALERVILNGFGGAFD